jgi:hypothetical protein
VENVNVGGDQAQRILDTADITEIAGKALQVMIGFVGGWPLLAQSPFQGGIMNISHQMCACT